VQVYKQCAPQLFAGEPESDDVDFEADEEEGVERSPYVVRIWV
jgi:hypothetical protein